MPHTEATISVTKPSMTKGYAIALTATTLWATTGILISYLLTNYAIAPLTLACWRDVIVSSVLAVILAVVRPSLLRIRRQDIPFFAAYGFFGVAVFNALWVYSVDFNGATLAVVLVYTGPAFVAIAAHWLFHEPITCFKVLAIVLSLAGCVLVTGAYDLIQLQLNPLGILCGMGVGVALGGIGVDRTYIEDVAVKKTIPLDSLVVKMSQEEAIQPMKREILSTVPYVLRVVGERIKATRSSGAILVIGVGNSSGVGNNQKAALEAEKNIKKIASQMKVREKRMKEKKKKNWANLFWGS